MNCVYCNKEIISKNAKKFCGRSCSATYANKTIRRKPLTKKCKCGEFIKANRVHCDICYKKRDVNNRTIEYLMTRGNTNTYDRIRAHAYQKYKKQLRNPQCSRCPYNKHIEICHIKAISAFPKTTLIKEVNDITNILFLCPNCHWEFDNLNGGP